MPRQALVGDRVNVPSDPADPDSPLVRGTVVAPIFRQPLGAKRFGFGYPQPNLIGYLVEVPERGQALYKLALCHFPQAAS